MLYTQTVEPRAFSILKQLMEIPSLKDFSLVGGTALSLLYGHRTSIDLDLFSNRPFENEKIIKALEISFPSSSLVVRTTTPSFGVFCFIDDVKIDMVRHPHPLVGAIKTIDGIRMFSTEDIIAMKVQAVLGRGRKKDFWDIAELLHHYPIENFINFHKEKYVGQNLLITVPQAITYFADAEGDEDPLSLKKQTWEDIKAFIGNRVRAYLE